MTWTGPFPRRKTLYGAIDWTAMTLRTVTVVGTAALLTMVVVGWTRVAPGATTEVTVTVRVRVTVTTWFEAVTMVETPFEEKTIGNVIGVAMAARMELRMELCDAARGAGVDMGATVCIVGTAAFTTGAGAGQTVAVTVTVIRAGLGHTKEDDDTTVRFAGTGCLA